MTLGHLLQIKWYSQINGSICDKQWNIHKLVACDKTWYFHMVENGRRWNTNHHKQRLFILLLNISIDNYQKSVDKW